MAVKTAKKFSNQNLLILRLRDRESAWRYIQAKRNA